MVSKTKIDQQVCEAVAVLRAGGVVVFPTETAYGLAADATNDRALERLAAIKHREVWKTPPLIVASRAMAERYAELTPALSDLVDKFWPGALTIVVRTKIPPLPEGGLGGVGVNLSEKVIRDSTIALRVSSNQTARALSKNLGAPITSTSANLAGGKECYRVEDARAQFASQILQPDYYLDVGPLEPHLPSTIVREVDGRMEVLRQGEIYVPTR
jgi:L-threonylcarbamoyladenylate synthase